MKYLLIVLLLFFGLIACTDLQSNRADYQIIWKQEKVIENQSFIDCLNKYITSRKVEEKGYSIAIETLLNNSQYAIFSVQYFNPVNDTRADFSIGYFCVDQTKCYIFTGYEFVLMKRDSLRMFDNKSDSNDEFCQSYIVFDKSSQKAEQMGFIDIKLYWDLPLKTKPATLE